MVPLITRWSVGGTEMAVRPAKYRNPEKERKWREGEKDEEE